MLRLFEIIVMIAVAAALVLALNFFVFLQTRSPNEEVVMSIDRGASLNRIAQDLGNVGVVSNAFLFKSYVLLKKDSGKIRAGEYHFPPQSKPAEILSFLMHGDFATHRVTIPEGWTLKEIAASLGKEGLINPERFLEKAHDPLFIQTLDLPTPGLDSLEGYLYPDTYEIYKPKNEEEVLKKLVDRFKEVWRREFAAQASLTGKSQKEAVILASIIEKESGNKDEQPFIASVFGNRLKKQMPLATDPTIIYGIPNFDGNLTRRDLGRPGPYNTYLNLGLPPTPISNPGRGAIHAALYPAETDYLFFVSKNDGTHQFSATEAEHFAAVRKYQIERRQSPETRPETRPETLPKIFKIP
jgi:UPF0755 protein